MDENLNRMRSHRISTGWIALLAGPLLLVGPTGCGGSSDSSATSPSPPPSGGSATPIQMPTVIDLYPHQSSTEQPIMTVLVTAVGTAAVRMPLGFDTGSAGVTLYAPSIFPSSMVTGSGFIFPAGSGSLNYNGITVTNVQATRSYGTINQTVEHGNLGFATLTFGDSAGSITTATMPVFLFYSVDYATGQGYAPPTWQGWFGVAATDGSIDVPGSVEPSGGYQTCTPQSLVTCYVVSALKYVDYANQVQAGFVLSPIPDFPTCDINTNGDCPAQASLTVGIDSAVSTRFSMNPLTCPPNGYVGPAQIAGYPVCQKTIDNVTIAASGESVGTYTSGAIFDTGTAYVYLSTPSDSAFPSSVLPGSTVSLTTPSGFEYSYIAGQGTANTLVAAGADGNSIIGVQYFTTNSYLLNFTSSEVGWK